MLTHSCRNTPRAAAHTMAAPNLAVIQGQMTSSPAPMARPTMTAPGPVIFQKGFVTGGKSASRRGRVLRIYKTPETGSNVSRYVRRVGRLAPPGTLLPTLSKLNFQDTPPLSRRIHKFSAAAPPSSALAAFPLLGLLDRVTTMPAVPSEVKPCQHGACGPSLRQLMNFPGYNEKPGATNG